MRASGSDAAMSINFKNSANKRQALKIRDDARYFLFTNGKLEDFFRKYGLEGHINCDYIRRQSQDVISGRVNINDVVIDKSEEII